MKGLKMFQRKSRKSLTRNGKRSIVFKKSGRSRRSVVWKAWLPFEAIVIAVAITVVAVTALQAPINWEDIVLGKIEHVRMGGEYQNLDRLELETILSPLIGKHLLSLDLSQMEQRISRIPWVKSVTISKVWPDSLIVGVEERTAVARWNNDALVDRDGQVFTPVVVQFQELPIFRAEPAGSEQALHLYYYLSDALRVLGSKISSLSMDASSSWRLGFEDGLTVTLGRRNIEQRIQRFIRAYRSGLHEVKDQVQCVDLRYPDGFSVAWKDEAGKTC